MVEKTHLGNKKLKSNIIGSSVFKAVTIVANLLLVRACVNYMGEEKYGIWLTLLSFFTWFSVFEVGITNNFRNKLTSYFTLHDYESGKSVVTTTYKLLAIVYIIIGSLLLLIASFLPIEQFFLPANYETNDFGFAFRLSALVYMLYFVAFGLNTILLSTHFTKQTYLIVALQSIVLLLGIYAFNYFGIKPTFTLVFLWFTAVPLVFWLIANFIFYQTSLKKWAPEIKLFFNKKLQPIQKNNWGFFVIQLCTIIILSTDNLIIINKLSGTEVLKYNVAFKYFNILIVVFNLVLIPYWSSFTEAVTLKNKNWVKVHVKKLVLFWVIVVLGAVILYVLSAKAYQLWIGKNLNIPTSLSFFMAISILLTTWNSIFAYFLNAITEIKVQMFLLLFSAALNIPLSLYLIDEFHTKGVIIATCIALLPLSIVLPIQYHRIITKMN